MILDTLSSIALSVIAPIFVVIALGFALDRVFRLDFATLTKVNLFAFVPALIFDVVSRPHQTSLSDLFAAAGFSAVMAVILFAVATAAGRLLGYRPSLRRAFANSVLLYNSGNFGLPVARLAFGEAGLGIQVGVILVQSILINTAGVFQAARGTRGVRAALAAVARMPAPYAIALGLAVRIAGLRPLPAAIDVSIHTLGEAMVPFALFTLGVGLSKTDVRKVAGPVFASNTIRLVVAPAIAFGILAAIGTTGLLAAVLASSAAYPTAVNTALIASEFDNEPDFSAAAVFFSTLLSAATATVVLAIAKAAYGV